MIEERQKGVNGLVDLDLDVLDNEAGDEFDWLLLIKMIGKKRELDCQVYRFEQRFKMMKICDG